MAVKTTKDKIKEDVSDIAETVKEETVETAKKAASTAKKTTKKAAKTVKEAAEKSTAEVKKTAARVRKPTTSIYIQYGGTEITTEAIASQAVEQFRETYEGVNARKLELYIKPEERAAYYVINSEYTGKVEF